MKELKLFVMGLLVGAVMTASITAHAYTALQKSITETGMEQGDLVKYLGNVRDAVNELITDHATNKTSMDATETLIEELHDDHATNKTIIDELKTDLNALKTDLGTIAAKMDLDGGITDTNYAAQIAGTSTAASSAATLTAAKPASAAATLTNSTALSLTP